MGNKNSPTVCALTEPVPSLWIKGEGDANGDCCHSVSLNCN